MKIKQAILLILIVLFAAIIAWVIWDNNRITVTEYTIKDAEIPENFSGYRILQISDLHNAEFGEDNEILLNQISRLHPDMIVITGDLIDSYHTNVDISLAFIREAVKIAPTYYVFGNHEVRIPESYTLLKDGMEKAGVVVLDQPVTLEKDSQTISLLGVADPSAMSSDSRYYTQIVGSMLKDVMPEETVYSILLCHRPEVFDAFVENGIDLAFTGHTHGGQVRIPFLGVIFSPDQGLFPKYDSGLFTEKDTTMIISRGLGNSLFPLRIFNRPELVVVTVESI